MVVKQASLLALYVCSKCETAAREPIIHQVPRLEYSDVPGIIYEVDISILLFLSFPSFIFIFILFPSRVYLVRWRVYAVLVVSGMMA